MARRWYYSHNGQTHGPRSAKEIKHLAATGGLQPDDLLWPDGVSLAQAVVASRALDFAELRRAAQQARRESRGEEESVPGSPPAISPGAEQLPGWIEEINQLFRDPQQAVGPVPDWLQASQSAVPLPPGAPDWLADIEAPAPFPGGVSRRPSTVTPETLPEPSLPPLAQPVNLPPTAVPPPLAQPVQDIPPGTNRPPIAPAVTGSEWSRGSALLDPIGIPPLEDPGHGEGIELPPPLESDPDPFRTARKQLATWFDLEKNQSRLASGNLLALRHDTALQQYLSHFEQYGPEKLRCLWEYVEFLIEHRKRL